MPGARQGTRGYHRRVCSGLPERTRREGAADCWSESVTENAARATPSRRTQPFGVDPGTAAGLNVTVRFTPRKSRVGRSTCVEIRLATTHRSARLLVSPE